MSFFRLSEEWEIFPLAGKGVFHLQEVEILLLSVSSLPLSSLHVGNSFFVASLKISSSFELLLAFACVHLLRALWE